MFDVCECNLPCPEFSAIGGGRGIAKGAIGGRIGGAGIELLLLGGGGGGGPKIQQLLVNF